MAKVPNVEKCFNTQPRGGGCYVYLQFNLFRDCFNTQPRGGGCGRLNNTHWMLFVFQHTAARRRLPYVQSFKNIDFMVSTHSRAEAAAPFDKRY